jgi:hypothetical protein
MPCASIPIAATRTRCIADVDAVDLHHQQVEARKVRRQPFAQARPRQCHEVPGSRRLRHSGARRNFGAVIDSAGVFKGFLYVRSEKFPFTAPSFGGRKMTKIYLGWLRAFALRRRPAPPSLGSINSIPAASKALFTTASVARLGSFTPASNCLTVTIPIPARSARSC